MLILVCIQVQLMVSLLLCALSQKPVGPVEQQQTLALCLHVFSASLCLPSYTPVLCFSVIKRLSCERLMHDFTNKCQSHQSLLLVANQNCVCVFLQVLTNCAGLRRVCISVMRLWRLCVHFDMESI